MPPWNIGRHLFGIFCHTLLATFRRNSVATVSPCGCKMLSLWVVDDAVIRGGAPRCRGALTPGQFEPPAVSGHRDETLSTDRDREFEIGDVNPTSRRWGEGGARVPRNWERRGTPLPPPKKKSKLFPGFLFLFCGQQIVIKFCL